MWPSVSNLHAHRHQYDTNTSTLALCETQEYGVLRMMNFLCATPSDTLMRTMILLWKPAEFKNQAQRHGFFSKLFLTDRQTDRQTDRHTD